MGLIFGKFSGQVIIHHVNTHLFSALHGVAILFIQILHEKFDLFDDAFIIGLKGLSAIHTALTDLFSLH